MSYQREKDLERELAEILRDGSSDEWNELKVWLFKENVRLDNLRKDLDHREEMLEEEKKQFIKHSESQNRLLEADRKRLERENVFFDQKMKLLKSGFEDLEEDRRKFLKEKDMFNAKKELYEEEPSFFGSSNMVGMLFRGVNNRLALKKRYKDLMKMFHPDNVAGDHDMVQLINREYEELKKVYDIKKTAY